MGVAAPTLEPEQMRDLMAAIRGWLAGREQVKVDSQGFGELKATAAVTVRRRGEALGVGISDYLPIVEACRQATKRARLAIGETALDSQELAALPLELELIGPREQVGTGRDSPEDLSLEYEPAVHGVAVRYEDNELLTRPSELLAYETLCDDSGEMDHRCDRYKQAIADYQAKLGLLQQPPRRPGGFVLFLRFRTTHIYQCAPQAEPVVLIAGMTPVPQQQANPEHLRWVADDLARFIRFRQSSDGLFAYEYLPGQNLYWPKGQNWIRQAATTWSIALHARRRNDEASRQTTQRAIEAFAKMVRPFHGHPSAAFVATPDGQHALGTTALFVLALIDSPDRDKYQELRHSLLNGLAGMQRADGSFVTHFPPATRTSSQSYFPGEALLAIAKQYELDRDAKWREVADKALPFYIELFRKERDPAFVPWQAQAYGHFARVTRLQKYADFVYEMSDFLAGKQIREPEPQLPIYCGGFATSYFGRSGVSSAVYLEGFVDAVRTAEAMGDRQRAERYREVVRLGARFVVQLRFREAEAYYVRSLRDTIGGVRSSPANSIMRIDNMQHALAAALGASEVLSKSSQSTSATQPAAIPATKSADN